MSDARRTTEPRITLTRELTRSDRAKEALASAREFHEWWGTCMGFSSNYEAAREAWIKSASCTRRRFAK